MSNFLIQIETPTGTILESEIRESPFYVGKDADAHIQIEGRGILQDHLRIMINNSGELLLISMGPGVLLDGRELANFRVHAWSGEKSLVLADHIISVIRLEHPDGEQTAEGISAVEETGGTDAIEDDTAQIPGDAPDFEKAQEFKPTNPADGYIDEGTTRPQPQPEERRTPPPQPDSLPEQIYADDDDVEYVDGFDELPDRGDFPDDNDVMNTGFNETAFGSNDPEPATAEVPQTPTDLPEAMPERITELYRGPAYHLEPAPEMVPADAPPPSEFTMKKDWRDSNKFGYQLPHMPIRTAVGERALIAIGLQNRYQHELELIVSSAGLPAGCQLSAPKPMRLASGDTRVFDLILNTTSAATEGTFNITVYIYDSMSPHIAVNFDLHIELKAQPNLRCWLEPIAFPDAKSTHFYIQNLTLEVANIVLAARANVHGVHMEVEASTLSIPPGQTKKATIQARVHRRPVWWHHRIPFQIAATHKGRAPLNFEGHVIVRPLWLRFG